MSKGNSLYADRHDHGLCASCQLVHGSMTLPDAEERGTRKPRFKGRVSGELDSVAGVARKVSYAALSH